MKKFQELIKSKYIPNKTVVTNFGYLSVLKILTLLIPLLTLPYLLKVLGRETYGLVTFSQAIIQYFLIIVSFGFNISATKDVAQFRENKEKLNEVVSSVFILKGLLFFISCLLLYVVIRFIPKAYEFRFLFYLTMYLCLYEWLFPIWFFQGIEKMKYITLINLFTRMLFLILIFFLVKQKSDYLMVPIINGIGALIAGIISLWIMTRIEGVRIRFQSISILKYYFIESLPLFLGSIAGKIKIITNKSVLGIFVGMESVAMYDIADKIKQLFLSFFEIFVATIYPNVARNKKPELVKVAFKWIAILGVCIYLFISLGMEILVPRYFIEYISVVNIFWILGLIIFLQPLGYLIGVTVLVVNDLKGAYTINLYWMTGLYLFLLLLLYSFDLMNIFTISACLVASIFLELVSRMYICRKNDLFTWLW